jgi:hypothetical protein
MDAVGQQLARGAHHIRRAFEKGYQSGQTIGRGHIIVVEEGHDVGVGGYCAQGCVALGAQSFVGQADDRAFGFRHIGEVRKVVLSGDGPDHQIGLVALASDMVEPQAQFRRASLAGNDNG